MKVAVIGCGSMGNKHVKHLVELGQDVVICDISPERIKLVGEKYQVAKRYTSHEEMARNEKLDAVIISTDTAFHTPIARFFAERGVSFYTEIPISDTMRGLQDLNTATIGNNVTSMVGMVWRFHPAMRKIKEWITSGAIGKVNTASVYGGEYLPDWHPGAPYKTEYSALRGKGGGVIITNISGVDYLRYFFGEVESVFGVYDSISQIGIEAEDFCMGILQFQNGTFAQWYTDFFQKPVEHRIEIMGDRGKIRWDHTKPKVELYQYAPLTPTGPVPGTTAGEHWQEFGYKLEDFWELYKQEMRHFLECVEKRQPTQIPVEDNIKTVAVGEALKQSFKARKMVSVRGMVWED